MFDHQGWGRCRCSFKWFTRKAVFARHFGKRQNWRKMRSHVFFGELQNTHLPENICRTSQDFRVVVWEKGSPLLHLVDFSYIVWTNSVQENTLRQQFTDARIYNPSLPPYQLKEEWGHPHCCNYGDQPQMITLKSFQISEHSLSGHKNINLILFVYIFFYCSPKNQTFGKQMNISTWANLWMLQAKIDCSF